MFLLHLLNISDQISYCRLTTGFQSELESFSFHTSQALRRIVIETSISRGSLIFKLSFSIITQGFSDFQSKIIDVRANDRDLLQLTKCPLELVLSTMSTSRG